MIRAHPPALRAKELAKELAKDRATHRAKPARRSGGSCLSLSS
jgi:hypothetical protein